MSIHGRVGQPAADAAARARTPELPRRTVDTRMPPAPARGGRVLTVGAPPRRRAGMTGGLLSGTLVLAIVVTVCWRYLRHRGGWRPAPNADESGNIFTP